MRKDNDLINKERLGHPSPMELLMNGLRRSGLVEIKRAHLGEFKKKYILTQVGRDLAAL